MRSGAQQLTACRAITKAWQKMLPLFLALLFTMGLAAAAQAQTITAQGHVTTDENKPLEGASVTVKGISKGVITDAVGHFSLSVTKGATLIISAGSGYEKKEIKVTSETVLSVQLKAISKSLDEVVIIGYGEQKRKDVNSAISSLKADDIKGQPVAGIDQLLQGKIAGVSVSQNSGAPGGGVSVKIRGISTFGGTEPLYVVDGVPLDGNDNKNSISFAGDGETNMSALSFLNPNDILSIDVLKDASATSIYGNRGSNGVVIITTKKGKAGEGKLSYDGYIGNAQIANYLDLMDLKQYAVYKNSIADFVGSDRLPQYADISLLGTGTDWQRGIFQNAMTQSHQLALSGGKAGTTYYISGNYFNQEGTVIGSGLKRKTARINLDNQVKPWLKLGINTTYSNTDQAITLTNNSSNNYTNVIAMAIQQAPDVPIYNVDGTFGGPSDVTGLGVVGGANPVAQAKTWHTQSVRNRLQSNIYLQTNFTKDISFRSDFGTDLTWGVNDAFLPTFAWGRSKNDLNTYKLQNTKNTYWNWRNTLTYHKLLNKVHDFTVLLGQEASKSTWNNTTGQSSKFSSNDIYSLSLGDPATATASENFSQATQASYFARLIYSYKNRYSVTANVRRDQTSKFADGHNIGYFPGASASWSLNNEPFFKRAATIFSQFKIRVGYGEVGNQNVPNYTYGSAINSLFVNSSAFGSGLGQYVSNYGNPDVTWEHQKQTNVGLDMSISRHFDLTVDLYNKISDKFLFADTYPVFTGTGSGQGTFGIAAPYTNFGKIQNKGIDAALSYHTAASNKVGWRSSLVVSHYKNIVKELRDANSNIVQTLSVNGTPTLTRTVVGQPIGQFYGYVVDGLYQNIAELYSSAIKSGNTRDAKTGTYLGDIKFKDLNGDGVIDASDRQAIGDPNPDFTFGFTNTFTYSNFDLSVLLTGSHGNKIFNYTRIWGEAMTATSGNQMASVANRWTPENTNTIIPRYANGDPNDNARISDRFIEDGSYMRIQNLSLGYSMPQMLLSKWKVISKFRMYVSVQNLYTFTKYSGYDPEVGPVNGNNFLNGVDLGRYPVPRTITFGINAEF